MLKLSMLLIFSLMGFASSWALALDNESALLSPEEKLILQKVHQRSYVGGIDEEPLKVQAQLPTASRKMQPAQEPVEGASGVENHSNDSND